MNLALRPLFRAIAFPAVARAISARSASAFAITAFSATIKVLALLCGLQAWSLWRAPAAWFPSLITVQLKPGETLILGQRELAAPQADKNHLALRRDADGGWMLRNLSATKQVVLQYADGEQRMGSVTLQAGQRFWVENKSFDVETSTAQEISFTHNNQHWRYDGATLYRDGLAQASCPDAHISARALALWNRAMPRMLTVPHALSFGGNVYCDNRLGLDGVTPGSAYLARNDGELRLSAGSPDGDRAALTLQTAATAIDLRQQELPLAGVSAIIVGHTRFQLGAQADRLTLAPSRRIALFNVAQLKLPPQIDWQWQQRALWTGTHGAALWPARPDDDADDRLHHRRPPLAVASRAGRVRRPAGLRRGRAGAATRQPSAQRRVLVGAGRRRIVSVADAAGTLIADERRRRRAAGRRPADAAGTGAGRERIVVAQLLPEKRRAADRRRRQRRLVAHLGQALSRARGPAHHRMAAGAVRGRGIGRDGRRGFVGRRDWRFRPATGRTGQAGLDRADRARVGTAFQLARAAGRPGRRRCALVAADRAGAAVPDAARHGAGAGRRFLAADFAAGVEHRHGFRLRRRRAQQAAGGGSGVHGAGGRRRHRLHALRRHRRPDQVGLLCRPFSGLARPGRTSAHRPATAARRARHHRGRLVGQRSPARPRHLGADCRQRDAHPGGAGRFRRLVLPQPPRPARRPAAVDRAGGVRDRHHAGGGAFLLDQRGRARLPPCALRALQLLHAVRRRRLRARPLPAVVGHQPGHLPDHGPADELFVGRRQPPAVFPVPPASLLCDQRAIFRGE